jgi:hypothetical protein
MRFYENFYLTKRNAYGYTNIIRPYYNRTLKQSLYEKKNIVLFIEVAVSRKLHR